MCQGLTTCSFRKVCSLTSRTPIKKKQKEVTALFPKANCFKKVCYQMIFFRMNKWICPSPVYCVCLASEDFDKSPLSKKGGIENTVPTVSLLGNNIHSWAWDPKTCSLYHAGRYLGRYPSKAIRKSLHSTGLVFTKI